MRLDLVSSRRLAARIPGPDLWLGLFPRRDTDAWLLD